MRRWLFLAVLALLIADASGVTALVEPETCSFASTTDRGPGTLPRSFTSPKSASRS
jgi:hypothetical protein